MLVVPFIFGQGKIGMILSLFQEPGEREVKIVSFTCSLEQLQDLVGKLKDAVRCVEKQVAT